jgi:hypothetical protein
MASSRKTVPRFRVGDWVSFLYGVRRRSAQIIEDRGRIGHKGRRLYRLRMDRDVNDTIEFEAPEVELEPADAPASPPK